ncbi:cytosolic sulfotransferase 15 [Capsicum annuum]|uniref:cytosolic sulfotransferase 15 n=1 Tax=Capsicum annuum TaxID=4072 RepID=UPI0007BFDC17|nr:cytosolic sulfotransferase 15 [Capsicum annuum]
MKKVENLETIFIATTSIDDQPKVEEELLEKLTQTKNWDGRLLHKYKGFWCPTRLVLPLVSIEKQFQSDYENIIDFIILATLPKSGTTWLKALIFSIINHHDHHQKSQLLTSNPHELIRFDFDIMYKTPPQSSIIFPKIFATHSPYDALPSSIQQSHSKIIYLCRNPLDQFISTRFFVLENNFEGENEPSTIEEALEMFIKGIHPFGPFWKHMLGYWYASLKDPKKVLFLKYEDIKGDTLLYVKKIAEFLGCSFSKEEEENGMIEDIVRICSFEYLKNLEVNKDPSGEFMNVKYSSFFRKGQMGDWANHLTISLAKSFDEFLKEKLGDSGLTFEIFTSTQEHAHDD